MTLARGFSRYRRTTGGSASCCSAASARWPFSPYSVWTALENPVSMPGNRLIPKPLLELLLLRRTVGLCMIVLIASTKACDLSLYNGAQIEALQEELETEREKHLDVRVVMARERAFPKPLARWMQLQLAIKASVPSRCAWAAGPRGSCAVGRSSSAGGWKLRVPPPPF
jgi:hypothetical protein